jgi:hypothetical protein
MPEQSKDLKKWETLVRELSKAKPNQSTVKDQMEKLGLDYNEDPVAQMSSVLSAFEQRNYVFKKRNKESFS